MALRRTKRDRGVKIRTVRSREERKRPSVFLRLKADESFRGVALFEPDPEAAEKGENPGYYEYYDHFDKAGNTYVPCSGEDCPFCAANDSPSTRALTAWYFPEAPDTKDQIKLFTMNFSTVEALTDEAEEEDGIQGKKIRIKRLDDRGNYRIKVLPDKPLTKKQQTELLKRLEDELLQGNGMEGLVVSQLKRQIERLKALDLLEDDDSDDDEDEDETPKSKTRTRRGKPAPEPEDEEEEEDEEEDEDESDENDEEDEDESDEEDEDEDEEDEEESDDDEDEEDSDEEGAPEKITAGVFTIVKINRKDEIFDLSSDEHGELKTWLGDGLDVDYETIKKGATVVVDAAQDEEGDLILTSIKLKGTRGRPRKTK